MSYTTVMGGLPFSNGVRTIPGPALASLAGLYSLLSFRLKVAAMSVALPNPQVGDPLRHEALSVFPLFLQGNRHVDYQLSNDALADDSLVVEEISEGGSVPELLVENKGDRRVLFLEGEELVGAKQNRILNTSVLVAAHTRIKIPVSCVEKGRWGYKSRSFGSSGSHSPSRLRRTLKASVTRSVQTNRGHQSDQSAVWREVDGLHMQFPCRLANGRHVGRFRSLRRSYRYLSGPPQICGRRVGRGRRRRGAGLGNRSVRQAGNVRGGSGTGILSGVVFDALETGDHDNVASVEDVERVIAAANELEWEQAEAVGEGAEYRAASRIGDHASVLAMEQTVVHGSVIASP